jgi:nitronate monooxygenase
VFKTWLTERFGLAVPVVSAPMGGVCDGRFAAAVSNAGALGTISVTGGSPDDVKREAGVAAESGRPYGIGLLAWTMPHQLELLEAAIEARPSLISLSFGDYARYATRIKEAGIVFATQAGTLDDAKAAVDAGADVVIARGGEGGGHGRDAVATLPLLQEVLDTVDVPVLAAGGIANARGLAAVLAAGAAGAWVGTAFLACTEGMQPDEHKQAVLRARDADTIYTTVLDIGRGVPWPEEFGGRAIRTGFAARWHGRDAELRQAGERCEDPIVWAGQAVGMVNETRSVADVVADFARADDLLQAATTRRV